MTNTTSIDTPAAASAIIRARRRERGLSQLLLAEASGVSRKFILISRPVTSGPNSAKP